MKLTFFLIAFFLVLLRVYLSTAGFGHHRDNEGNFTMTSDNYILQINWSGKFKLSDDEKSIAGVSPGGYLKFRENDTKLSAESNLQGEISYTLPDGQKSLSLDDSGRRFVAATLQKIIAFGFYSDGRAERIYKKGGNRALLDEIPNMKLETIKGPYFDRLFKSDTLTKAEMLAIIRLIDSAGSDLDKQKYLVRFTGNQLRDSTLAQAWLAAVERFGPDFEKQNLLTYFIKQGPVGGSTYDSLVTIIGRFGGEFEKQDLFKKLLTDSLNTDEQWVRLINETERFGADFIKVDLLLQIAKKMPKTDTVKATYLKTAKTLGGDAEYGRVLRALN